jgi:hypothetical protein
LVTPGNYKVLFSYLSTSANVGSFDIAYGSRLLAKDLYTGNYANNRNLRYVEVDLGNIHVPVEGEVTVTFTCTKNAPSVNNGTDGYQLVVDYLRLQPVDE